MVVFRGIKFMLMDIEGTISDIAFVREVLFPYSARELRNFVSQKRTNPQVQDCLRQTGAADSEGAVQQLLRWIQDDVKHPALKTLQGLIWERGYKEGAFHSHLYPDVLPAWQSWRAQGLRLGIYSSGSIAAQKLFFTYTENGDVLPELEAHFDLSTGPKKEADSYRKIAESLNLAPATILFFSDVPAELDAAREAGLNTVHVLRPGTPSANWPAEIRSLDEVHVTPN